jgi:Protein of unknown function (DUF2849)
MAKAFVPQVLTANRLRLGDVVYLDARDQWVADVGQAVFATDAEQLAKLEAIAAKAVAAQYVVAVYPIDVATTSGAPVPTSVKERIRAAHGPTV